MTEINWDRMQPLRVAAGSHSKGSGKGCAMNVVSYINGDTEITDFPDCSDRNLAARVQAVNDQLARREDNYLSPRDAVAVIRLGVMTMGTGGLDTETLSWEGTSDAVRMGVLMAQIKADQARAVYRSRRLALIMQTETGTGRPIPFPYFALERERKEMIDACKDYIRLFRKGLGLDDAPEVTGEDLNSRDLIIG